MPQTQLAAHPAFAADAATALVTGATSGIGRDAALTLARRGVAVFATGRNAEALAALTAAAAAESLPLIAFRLDVTDPASIEAAVRRVDDETGGRGVDVLVNNAGYGLLGPMAEILDGDLRAQFETNVFGLVAVTRAFAAAMIRRKAGRIINVSSLGGTVTMPMMGAYNATKYAVESISDALRMELGALGVKVSIIEPGPVRTGFDTAALASLEPYKADSAYANALTRADDVAGSFDRAAIEPAVVTRAIVHAATANRPRARYVAPRWMGWGATMLRALPTCARDALMRRATGLTERGLAA